MYNFIFVWGKKVFMSMKYYLIISKLKILNLGFYFDYKMINNLYGLYRNNIRN